ncbi:hypothetical protein JNUCC1_01321 [Lentibacillus sp. JNUCC-1]|nr:hypothetical protein [Lentibacillus sp. JNUCC-1]MUV37515.1 hypothetical protein [Lentibacillus sp. JNUCC-1]
MRKLNHIPEKEIQSFITDLEVVLQKDRMSKQEFLQWTKRIDQVRKEVEA